MYNEVQPTYLPLTSRIIVIGDVHGDISRLMKCMYEMNLFSKDLKWIAEPKDTIVVQLGDQIDSMQRVPGPEWEVLPDIEVMLLMEQLDKIARLSGGRVLSLIGNHELMNVIGDYTYVSPHSLNKITIAGRKELFKHGSKLCQILAKRNIVLKIGPFLFCHGGILPYHLDMVGNNLHMINDKVRKPLISTNMTQGDVELFVKLGLDPASITWTREYMVHGQANHDLINAIADDVLERTECTHIFVGHNTVENIQNTARGRIIFTDNGISRAYSKEHFQIIEIITKDDNTSIGIITL